MVLVVCSVLSMKAAERLALDKGRSPKTWMRAAIVFGPVAVAVLALLPPIPPPQNRT
jgi:hypothetical protein